MLSEVDRILMIANCYGLMTSIGQAKSVHIPLALVPSKFPSEPFNDLIKKTPKHNELMRNLSQLPEYLYQALEEVAKTDEFTRKLIEISKKAKVLPYKQEIFLGLTRNDFILDQFSGKFLQVEYNTISASFVALSSKISAFHQHVISQFGEFFDEVPKNVLENDPLKQFGEGIKLAFDLYGSEKAAVMFVVLEDEKNLFDQTFIEVELWQRW